MNQIDSASAGGAIAVRAVPARDVSRSEVRAWAELETRCVEPNAYLSPHFVLPANRHLTPHADTLVLFVERLGAGRDLIGVGIFDRAHPSVHFPLRRMQGYRSQHSFLGGLLLDRAFPVPALQALLRFIDAQMPGVHGVELHQVWTDGVPAQAALACAGVAGRAARSRGEVPRAVLVPATCPQQLANKTLASRVRDLDRRKRRLSERGRVTWRCHRAGAVTEDVVEAFLALEHQGWKGSGGSSLRSQPADEAFFREAVRGFASEGRALFTELCLDDAAIASCCSFISGRVGFGFKIGWDPQYRFAAPAKLNEIEMMRNAPMLFGDIDYFDSGAGPDSYINELWLERRSLTTLFIATGYAGMLALRLAGCAQFGERLLRAGRAGVAPRRATEPELAS